MRLREKAVSMLLAASTPRLQNTAPPHCAYKAEGEEEGTKERKPPPKKGGGGLFGDDSD